MAMLVTHIAASTCSFFWMLIEYAHKRQFTLVGAVSGAVTGLVVITPAAGFVDQTGAFVMGLLGALCCYPAVVAKNKFGLDQKATRDDYPDAFGVHAIGGMVGTFWTGLFANPEINLLAKGAFYFNDKLLGWQIVGIIFVVLWSAVLTTIIMLALKFTIGIDVPDEEPEADSTEFAEVPKAPLTFSMPGPSLNMTTPPPPALMMPIFTMPVQHSMPMQQSHMNYVNPYNPVMGQPRPFLGSI
jgi:Amt family ammonium transporter